MNPYIIINSGIAFLILWVFWYVFWKDYVIDKFRQDIFGIRDELFSAVAHNQTPMTFDTREYTAFRMELNSMIRCVPNIGVLRLVLVHVLKAIIVPNVALQDLDRSAMAIQEKTPESIREFLKPLQERTANSILRYLITISPTFVIIILVVAVGATVTTLFRNFLSKMSKTAMYSFPKNVFQVVKEKLKTKKLLLIDIAVLDNPLEWNSARLPS